MHTTKSQTSFPSPNQIAVLLPVTILAHQLEEYFGQFPQWYSNLLNAQLSNRDFILINSIGLFVFTVDSILYFFNKNNMILVGLGTLVFVNGCVHFLASLFTLSYSPGTITGVVLFIPLGTVIYKKILPMLRPGEKVVAIAIGILVLVMVSTIASNM